MFLMLTSVAARKETLTSLSMEDNGNFDKHAYNMREQYIFLNVFP